jgi:hypothetical protein
MKLNFSSRPLAWLVTTLLLTACGGGNGGATVTPPITTTAEGLYTGTVSNGNSIDGIILEDGSYYVLSGFLSAGTLYVSGFSQGTGTSSNGNFSSTNFREFFYDGSVVSGSLNATYSTNNTFSGTITAPGVVNTFTAVSPASSSYVYNSAAKVSDIAGSWTLSNMKGGAPAFMNIAANGSFTASSGGCSFSGAITPRPSGKNIFNITATYGAAPCTIPGQTVTGIAIDYLLANGTRELIAAGSNIGGTVGTAYFGLASVNVTNTNTYTIGGNVSGLVGSVVLQNNLGDNLTVSNNGTFTFATPAANGSSYSVSVFTQPSGQTCSVSTGAGAVSGGNITSATLVCSNNSYNVGGSVSGLTGTVVLQDNLSDNLTVSANGAFTFATPVANSSPYSVTVLNQPYRQSCLISNGAGSMGSANVTSVTISCSPNTSGYIYTVAGNGSAGYAGDNGPSNLAQINHPFNVAVDSAGNLYIADEANNRIRKVDSTGTIITVAGNGTLGYSGDSGPATSAQLNCPTSVAVDSTGSLYITDACNNRIRKVDTTGTITTIAGTGVAGYFGDNGPATSARINSPSSIVVDGVGNVYFADELNNRIRKVDTGGTITTVAGNGTLGYSGDNGPATSAMLDLPSGVAVDSTGNLFISDNYNNRIRQVTSTGTITTVAGTGVAGYSGDSGPATSATINLPTGVAVDGSGNLYIADNYNNRIRKVDIGGTITTVAGTGVAGYSGDNGPATSAQIYPLSVSVDSTGNVYLAGGLDRVRMVAK